MGQHQSRTDYPGWRRSCAWDVPGAEPLTFRACPVWGPGGYLQQQVESQSQCREKIGKGYPLEEVLAVPWWWKGSTLLPPPVAWQRRPVDLPIASALMRILAGEVSPKDAVDELMTRELKLERI